jgi:3-carboxymethyl-3-hydroxy-acyl-[acp] dehydratase
VELTIRSVALDRGTTAPTIDDATIGHLHAGLDAAQDDPSCRILLLTSTPGVFCTGMNLTAAGHSQDADAARLTGGAFFDLLRRFTLAPLIVACAVDGQVAGGGVGLAAAADLVLATERSTFALPEALWGLLPCCVLPFLIRRTGFQRAYAMTITTRPISALEAAGNGLVDEVGADLPALSRRLALRASKVDSSTIADLKRYAHRLWPLSDRELAVDELSRLMGRPAVRERLSAFAASGRYPWER